LHSFLKQEYQSKTIYPKQENILKAFKFTPYEEIKVVIIGQDPYHEEGQAQGLAFSVPDKFTLPPSLRNIYKEIQNDLNVEMDFTNGDLTYLTSQGVLLLNTILTVEKGKALSHDKKEYKTLVKDVLSFIDKNDNPIVFILWGGHAKALAKYITNPHRLILCSSHPSPLSANQGGFFNQHLFSQCNDYLEKNNRGKINWKNSQNMI
ncbi:MAG: uracil-DNA glycosylase, partial [Bacilli bacterium]|nr:uracil-DNA glycosylase [Bacilli bacterium]